MGISPSVHEGYVDTSEQLLVETGSRVKRQKRSVEEKRRIVEETLEVGASVARVAMQHAVNANQVFAWRRKYREGRLGKTSKLLPVTITDPREKQNRTIFGSESLRPLRSGRWRSSFSRSSTSGERPCGGRSIAHGAGVFARMISLPAGTRIWIAAGVTDLRQGFIRA